MASSLSAATKGGMSTAAMSAAVAGFILAVTALRLVLAGHFELAEDEAYYWLWSRDPAFGYFDHPPMVAWWIAAGRMLFGDTELGVRAVGVVALLPATYFAFRTHELLFASRRRALISVLWLHATVFVTVGGVVMSPDTPAILFWVIAVYGLAQVLRSGRGEWWYLVGAAVGCALLSKYTALFLGLGIVLWLALAPAMRHWFARIELYVAGAIAALIVAPNLYWNAEHGWISFTRQLGRFDHGDFAVRFVADFIGGQLGMFTPVICTFAAFAFVIGLARALRERQPEWVLIAAMTAPLIAVFLEYSLHDRVQANWMAIIAPTLIIAGVEIGVEDRYGGFWRQVRLSSFRVAAPLGYLVAALVYAQAAFDIVTDRGSNDPTSRLKGWSILAGDVAAVAEVEGAHFVATTNYGLNALLAFYSDPSLRVVQVTERERYIDLTMPPVEVYAKRGLYVVRTRKDWPRALRKVFRTVEPVAMLERRRPGGVIETLNVYRLEGPVVVPPFVDLWA